MFPVFNFAPSISFTRVDIFGGSERVAMKLS